MLLNHYRQFVRCLPFAAAVLVSLVVLFTPASGVPTSPPGTDKVIHFVLFTTLAVTGRLAGIEARASCVLLACYAVGSELLQAALPLGRSGDMLDAATDLLGVGTGLAVSLAFRRLVRAVARLIR